MSTNMLLDFLWLDCNRTIVVQQLVYCHVFFIALDVSSSKSLLSVFCFGQSKRSVSVQVVNERDLHV